MEIKLSHPRRCWNLRFSGVTHFFASSYVLSAFAAVASFVCKNIVRCCPAQVYFKTNSVGLICPILAKVFPPQQKLTGTF